MGVGYRGKYCGDVQAIFLLNLNSSNNFILYKGTTNIQKNLRIYNISRLDIW